MNKNIRLLKPCLLTLGAVLALSGCASMNPGTKLPDRISILSRDRVFLRVAAFDSTVQAELRRAGLDPAKTQADLSSELRYQLFLKKQEESPDSAGATVRVLLSFQHLQPGMGNSGSFVSGSLSAEREGKTERAAWESRQPAKENVPAEFLSLQMPRALAQDVVTRMKSAPKRSGEMDNPPPLILFN
jgi:hypothetical protein